MNIRPLRKRKKEGFSLIEVLLGIALVGVAMLGLAQLFVMSVNNNRRADMMSNATFLAQQGIDNLRNLTPDEKAMLPAVQDELINVNGDKDTSGNEIYDFRRITLIDFNNMYYKVWVFPASEIGTSQGVLLADPAGHRVMAQMGSILP